MEPISRPILALVIALASLSLVVRIISIAIGEGTQPLSDLAHICSQGTIILLAVTLWGRK